MENGEDALFDKDRSRARLVPKVPLPSDRSYFVPQHGYVPSKLLTPDGRAHLSRLGHEQATLCMGRSDGDRILVSPHEARSFALKDRRGVGLPPFKGEHDTMHVTVRQRVENMLRADQRARSMMVNGQVFNGRDDGASKLLRMLLVGGIILFLAYTVFKRAKGAIQ